MNLVFHRSRLWTVLLIVVLLVSGIAVSAQDTDFCESPGVDFLEYGDTVEGTIDDDIAAAVFCFEGEEGDVVTITIETTDGDLEPVIALADPTLNEIFAQDDGRSSAEVVFELPDDGVYLIFATRVDLQDGDTEGDYELTLDAEGAAPPDDPEDPSEQPVGVNPDLPQIAASANGAIAVSFPEDWQVLVFEEGDGLIIGNSDEAMEGDIGSGDFSMRVSFYLGDFVAELVESETFEEINETIGDRPSPLHLAVLEFLVFSASAEDEVEITEFDDGPDINGNPSAILRLDPGDRTEVFVLSFETDEGDYISLVSRARSNDIGDFEETIFLIAENILTGDAVEEVMGGDGGDGGNGGGGDVFCEVTPVSRDVNVREEPTTNSDLVGTLESGDSAVAVGQAEDNGGFIWWELEDGGFVREDTVDEEGDCEELPESN